MHRTRLYNTLIVLTLLVSLFAPAPVLAEDLPPGKATPTGIIASFTTVGKSPDPSAPRLSEGAGLQAASLSKIFLPLTTGGGGSAPVIQPFTFINHASYPIVYLKIDGINQFPVSPLGILSGGTYQMDLAPGTHTYEIRTGHWNTDNNSRFDMYTYSGQFATPQYNSLTVEDVSLAGILTQFSSSGVGYWEGDFWTSDSICYTAAFKFYSNYTYEFFVSNVKQATGNYSLVSRSPDIFGLTFDVGLTEKALLIETHGEFYLNNGPASWKQITYNYTPGGYVYNPFCP